MKITCTTLYRIYDVKTSFSDSFWNAMERLVYNVVSGTPIPIASCVNRSQIFSTFYFESTNNAQLLAIDSINYYWFCQSFVNQMQLLCWKRKKSQI